MYSLIPLSTNLFKDLGQPESLVVLAYLVFAFILGAICYWLANRKDINQLYQKIAIQEKEIKDQAILNKKLMTEQSGKKGSQSAYEKEQTIILEDLHKQVTELKQSHFYLKKDYDMALKALESAREQAEQMQNQIKGASVLPAFESPKKFIEAKERLKKLIHTKLSEQTADLSFKKEVAQKIGDKQVAMLDHLDQDIILTIAHLLEEQSASQK